MALDTLDNEDNRTILSRGPLSRTLLAVLAILSGVAGLESCSPR